LVITPFIISQSKQIIQFPTINEALGYGKTPLLMSLPVNHYIEIFRPQHWGFHVFSIERGFAYYWGFKTFIFFICMFLFFMLLTKNNFWLSVLGASWIFFSSFMQWWFSTPAMLPEMIAMAMTASMALVYLLYSNRISVLILASIVLLVSFINFTLFFYPPFQIPIGYLFLFIVIGYILKNSGSGKIKKKISLKLLLMAVVLIGVLIVGFYFYNEIKETVNTIFQTSYPGKRNEIGGGMSLGRIFSGSFDYFWNENYFPRDLGNVPTGSNFLLVFPVVFFSIIWDAVRRGGQFMKRSNTVYILLMVYIMFISAWMIFGFSSIVLNITLFKFVPPIRALVGLGLGSIILSIIYLAEGKKHSNSKIFIISILWGIFIFWCGYNLNKQIHFFNYNVILLFALFSFCLVFFFLKSKIKHFSFLLASAILVPNFPINPIVRGLAPITDKKIVKQVSSINSKNNGAKWLVFGNFVIANLLKTTGANVINGVNFVPDLKKNQILDPQKKYLSIYNRYAHIEYAISENDEIHYELNQTDKYTVYISPCSPKIKELGVKFIVIPGKLTSGEMNCLQVIGDKSLNGMNIYRLR